MASIIFGTIQMPVAACISYFCGKRIYNTTIQSVATNAVNNGFTWGYSSIILNNFANPTVRCLTAAQCCNNFSCSPTQYKTRTSSIVNIGIDNANFHSINNTISIEEYFTPRTLTNSIYRTYNSSTEFITFDTTVSR